jgi:hypothetical protein
MNWWVTLYPRHRRRGDTWNRFLRELLEAESTLTLGLDRAAVELCLQDVRPGSHLAAFATVLSAYARQRNRPRWGEKTLLAEFYAHDVLTALPETKVIHLIRDPRDVFSSYRHAPWRVPARGLRATASASLRGHVVWTLRSWSMSARLARTNAARHAARYFVLRYEDLVGDPQRELERVCAFLGEPFDRQMLEMNAYPDWRERGGNSSFGRLEGVSQTPVGRFRTVLPPRSIALCEVLAGAELERQGYARAGVALGPAETLRMYGLDAPQSAFIRALHAGVFWAQGPRA